MKILALIPARGGSKGIQRKNIKVLSGKPLIGWTIEAAQRSSRLSAIVVSTEDQEIAKCALELGAQVPFMRPAELADDHTPGIDPVLHALDMLPGFDAVLLLQPTSPLRTAADIDACIELAEKTGAPCVVSVSEPAHHPHWMYRLDEHQRLHALIDQAAIPRRQELPPVFAANGALYFARTNWLKEMRTFITPQTVGHVMPPQRSIDIDTMLDWTLAELLLKEAL